MTTTRRDFLKTLGAAAGTLSLTGALAPFAQAQWAEVQDSYRAHTPADLATDEDYWAFIQREFSC